jgi:phosphohistidine phosphatase SixA
VTGWSAEVESCDELSGSIVPVDLALELGQGQGDALLVGHQPTLEMLVHRLVAPAASTRPSALVDGFCTAMIVALRTVEPCSPWTIEAVLDPRRVPSISSPR